MSGPGARVLEVGGVGLIGGEEDGSALVALAACGVGGLCGSDTAVEVVEFAVVSEDGGLVGVGLVRVVGVSVREEWLGELFPMDEVV